MNSCNQHFTSNILHSSACNLSTGGEAVKGFRLILLRGQNLAVKQVKTQPNWTQIPSHFFAWVDSDKPGLQPP